MNIYIKIFLAILILLMGLNFLYYKNNSISYTTTFNQRSVKFMKYFAQSSPEHLPTFSNENISEALKLQESIGKMGSLPLLPEFLLKIEKKDVGDCGIYPNIFNIHFNNNYWQMQSLKGSRVAYLLNAYVDTRESEPLVRIIAMIDDPEIEFFSFCQFWYKDRLNKPKIVQVQEFRLTFYETKEKRIAEFLHPYLITCPLPDNDLTNIPDSVSLVLNQCDRATNNLKIIFQKPPEKVENFAVCVKGLDFPNIDISARLIEWIELLLIFGVSKFYIYEFYLNPNTKKVLNYYEEKGIIEVFPITWPGFLSSEPQIQHYFLHEHNNERGQRLKCEVVHYNDCLYRIYNKYKYIAIIDTDEIIMPMNQTNWLDMIQNLGEGAENSPGYFFRMHYFFDEPNKIYDENIPPYLHMLKHVERAKVYSKPPSVEKSILDTSKVLTIFNHFPISCLPNRDELCIPTLFDVPISQAKGHHYRKDWGHRIFKNSEKDWIFDDSILRFKDDLINRSNFALRNIGLLA